jgi:4-oxalocrotonate tautomerase family enzyme
MPIMQVHLQTSAYSQEQVHHFLERASTVYAEVLDSPIERVRIFIHDYPAGYIAVGGKVSSDTGVLAPFFEAFMLEGRPISQQHAVLEHITDVLVECFHSERSLVRGVCTMVSPEHWGIAGKPAAAARAAELSARENQNS